MKKLFVVSVLAMALMLSGCFIGALVDDSPRLSRIKQKAKSDMQKHKELKAELKQINESIEYYKKMIRDEMRYVQTKTGSDKDEHLALIRNANKEIKRLRDQKAKVEAEIKKIEPKTNEPDGGGGGPGGGSC